MIPAMEDLNPSGFPPCGSDFFPWRLCVSAPGIRAKLNPASQALAKLSATMGKAQCEGKEQEPGDLDSQLKQCSGWQGTAGLCGAAWNSTGTDAVCQEQPECECGSPSLWQHSFSILGFFFGHKASLPGVESWSPSLHTQRDFLQGWHGITNSSVIIN